MSCLDDACLLNIFRFLTPLPDLFAAAAVCKVRRPRSANTRRNPTAPDATPAAQRWHKVAADSRLRLVVAADGAPAGAPLALWGAAGCNRFATLAAAAAASAPGQSICFEPGEHALDDVHIRWPLALSGAPGCLLRVPAAATRGLAVHAACRLQALDVRSAQLTPCVEHLAGRLRIERCALRCADAEEHPLAHLSAPILCRYARGDTHTLSVAESRCEGGAAAVRFEGGGRLARVRVIYWACRAALWFEVEPTGTDEAAAVVAAEPLPCAAPLEPPPVAAKLTVAAR